MKKLNKKQLDTLYECWKEGNNTKERLEIIEKNMPKVAPIKALKVMRKMAKTNPKWLKWETRQKNQKEKMKLEKRKEKEERKKKREEKKIKKENKKKQEEKINHISKNLDKVKDKIKPEFFFCSDVNQFASNISCIFRIFGEISFGNPCDKCKKMNRYISIIEEEMNERPKKVKGKIIGRNKAGEGSET